MAEKSINSTKISISILVVLIAAALIFTGTTAHKRFSRSYAKQLEVQANSKYLEFNSGFNSEMVLAMQMAKSPVIVAYMENPSNPELAQLGMEEIAKYQDSFSSHITFWIGDNDLKYYSNGEYVYTLDKSNASSAWYINCMQDPGDYELNVDYDIGLKVTNVWVNAIVRNEKHKAIGLIGTGISLSSFIDSMYKNLDPKYQFYMYNANLETTGSDNAEYLEKKTPITEVITDLDKNNLKPAKTSLYSSSKGDYIVMPLPALNWYILIYKSFGVSDFFSVSLIYFVLVLALIFIWLVFLTLRHLLAPLISLQSTIDEIAEGNADLTVRIKLDEGNSMKLIQNVVNSVNKFIEKIQTIITNINNTKNELIESGNELHDGTQDTEVAINQIIDNVQKCTDGLSAQTERVESTAGFLKNLSDTFTQLDNSVASQSENVKQASSAVEKMIETIKEVNSSVGILSSAYTQLDEETIKGVTQQEEVSSKINKIKDQSEILQSANEIIANIAEQTNLLAMNAAIEAAHAGDAGKGFSVVADEIRKLSETSSQQSNTIGNQLKAIQESISSISLSSSESKATYSLVAQDINTTKQLVEKINSNMVEQEQGSRQINVALSSLNSSMEEVKNATGVITDSSNQITTEMRELEKATFEMTATVGEMNSGAEKISATGQALSSTADKVDSSINAIGKQIDEFKV